MLDFTYVEQVTLPLSAQYLTDKALHSLLHCVEHKWESCPILVCHPEQVTLPLSHQFV
jgi:hypothetical protein